jgi:hypothetical protein
LPPILHDIQPGQGLDGKPRDYDVTVIRITRGQIEAMLGAVEQERPELCTPWAIVRAFLCRMDSIRDETKLWVAGALSSLPPDATQRRQLDGACKMLGQWDTAHRLLLRC